MRLINGRTPEQWAAYDRAKLIGATALALALLLLSVSGLGPGRAARCCSLPAEVTAVPPPAVPAPTLAPAPEATPPPAPTPDPACAGALDTAVLFATNSAELTAEGGALLDRLAPCWRSGRFEVGGHTDASGSDAINQRLSEARARAVVEHLVSRGIAQDALTPRGYASSRPVADNATVEGRARNRRVEFRRE